MAIPVIVENKSGKSLTIQFLDTSVNGYMFNFFYYMTVADGKMAISDITLYETELEDNDIEEIENIEFGITAFAPGEWNAVIDKDGI